MARETEIKLKIDDRDAFERELTRMGAEIVCGLDRVHEENTIFDTPQYGLANHGQVLRIRVETPRAGTDENSVKSKRRVIVTFKQPTEQHPRGQLETSLAGGYKVREEFELEVADALAMAAIFEGLGMRGWFRYEKYRTTYRVAPEQSWAEGLLIEVDETPVGVYAELEGRPEAIDRAAKELGFSRSDYVAKNYLTLYREQCQRVGEEPKDMLFPK
jgi:adenylate cyclase class 2